jgi:phosphatidate cytidylyltransferase
MRREPPSPALPHKAGGSAKRHELAIRIAVAAVLIPIVLVDAWLGGAWFAVLVAAGGLLMAREWCAIVHGGSAVQLALHGTAVIAAAFVPVLGPGTALAAIAALWLVSAGEAVAGGRPRSFWAFAGLPYVSIPVLSLVLLRSDPDHGFIAIVWLFVVVWLADTLALAVGRTVGGPKLAPAISPGKTWAGLIGAVGGAAFGAGVVAVVAGLPAVPAIIALGGFLGTVEQAGDLFESALKRRHGLKDSSHLIPGHGGMMDRVDGLVAAAMAVALIGSVRAGPGQAAAGALIW